MTSGTVKLPWPSLRLVHDSGRSRRSALRAAGVRSRRAMVSERLWAIWSGCRKPDQRCKRKRAEPEFRPSLYRDECSYLHDFDFFFSRELFHATDLFVSHLLNFFHGALLFVFADLLFFGEFLKRIVAVAANVADRGAVLFKYAIKMFHDIPAALLGHGRDGNADEFAIRERVEAEIGGLNSFFDLLDDGGI